MSPTGLTIRLNGESAAVPEGSTVAAVVSRQLSSDRGVAVAVNREVVPRSSWTEVHLAEGDEVEILTAAQGG